ncbi:hypothetical protein TNCV_689841 [Trichonephila clavipes]|nr:hypothetical protein TNCV_689841 [Trichonephila clavipes]
MYIAAFIIVPSGRNSESSLLEHWTPDWKAWVRYPMPPNTLRVHTEYVLVKSVGPKVLWAVTAEPTTAGAENISLPSSSVPKLGGGWRSVVSTSIVMNSNLSHRREFHRAKSYCHDRRTSSPLPR